MWWWRLSEPTARWCRWFLSAIFLWRICQGLKWDNRRWVIKNNIRLAGSRGAEGPPLYKICRNTHTPMTVMEAWAVTLSTSVMTSQEYSAVSFNWTSVTLSVLLSKIVYLHTDTEAHVYNPNPEMLILTLMAPTEMLGQMQWKGESGRNMLHLIGLIASRSVTWLGTNKSFFERQSFSVIVIIKTKQSCAVSQQRLLVTPESSWKPKISNFSNKSDYWG